MDVPLLLAGSIALLGAAVHGGAGELLVVRRLSAAELPGTRFGGGKMTRTMIHASWHITTVAFVTVACALIASGSVLDGDAARGVAVFAAIAVTGFAAVVLGLGGAAMSPMAALRHPGPPILTATAVLAWWGAL